MKRFQQNNLLDVEKNRRKVFGIEWHLYSDELSVDLKSILNEPEKLPTKRNIFQKNEKIFHPIDILAPYMINAKMLLQLIWKENFQWDHVISIKVQRVQNR